jgi:hypothetical protein
VGGRGVHFLRHAPITMSLAVGSCGQRRARRARTLESGAHSNGLKAFRQARARQIWCALLGSPKKRATPAGAARKERTNRIVTAFVLRH